MDPSQLPGAGAPGGAPPGPPGGGGPGMPDPGLLAALAKKAKHGKKRHKGKGKRK